jgi:hypothetical protein
MTIVTNHYRYKRPPRRKKAQPAEVAGPAIVTAAKPKPGRSPEPTSARQSAIIRKASRVPDLTQEELKRRGDAADAMFQEMKRRIAEKR